MHVGWTMRLEGAPPSLAALRRHLSSRLDAVPRFRRRVVRPALGISDPFWVDDPGFDIARHVDAVTVPAPGGPGELRETASALLSVPLPRHRPLWRLYLVDGLTSGWAVVGQAHHALVDGIAAIEVAMLLFEPADEPQPPRTAAPWHPAPAPSFQEATTATASARASAGASTAFGALRSVASGRIVGQLRQAREAVETLATPAPTTALDHNETHERAVAFGEVSLDGVRKAGRRHGCTINDVVLAASSLAIGRALRRRGETPESIKALVPVSTRADGELDELGNRISFITVTLPTGEIDPVRALRAVRGQTQAAKAGQHAAPLDALARTSDLLPGVARRVIARSAARAAAFNVVVSNVPGPPIDLALMGRRLLAVHPMVPFLDGHSLSIGVLSYRGRLQIGLSADAAVVPDALDVARDLEQAFDALRAAPSQAPTPWRTRARTRRDRAARTQRATSR